MEDVIASIVFEQAKFLRGDIDLISEEISMRQSLINKTSKMISRLSQNSHSENRVIEAILFLLYNYHVGFSGIKRVQLVINKLAHYQKLNKRVIKEDIDKLREFKHKLKKIEEEFVGLYGESIWDYFNKEEHSDN